MIFDRSLINRQSNNESWQINTLNMRFLKVLIIMTFVSVSYQKKSFDNHKVVTFRIQNEEQLKEIQSLESEPGVKLQKNIFHANI